MKHFWLNPREQATMDQATSTASSYGYIAAVDVSMKPADLANMVGGTVAAHDNIRVHPLIRRSVFRFMNGQVNGVMSVKALVRLNASQATLVKVSNFANSTDVQLREDPTGESWGNLLMGQFLLTQTMLNDPKPARNRVSLMVENIIRGDAAGATLAHVANFAEPLPDEWQAAFVRYYEPHWHGAHDPRRRHPDIAGNVITDNPPAYGQVWAHTFYERCQNVDFRKSVGIK